MSVPETIAAAGGETRWLDRPDGMRLRYAVFGPAGERGWCVLLPGYTEFIEKHLETVGDLRARGFGVVVLDWRGQGLSGRALADRSKGHVKDFDDHLNDLDAVIAACPELAAGRRTMLGHSMGGHLTIRHCHRHPDAVSRAVVIAPMMGVTRLGPAGAALVRGIVRVGFAGSYIFGGQPYGPRRAQFDGNRLTSDPQRFARLHRLIAANPDLALADPTMGWVDAAWRSIALTRKPGWLEAVRTPLLVAIAGNERIVDNRSTERALRRLPNATAVRIDGAEHELLGETDAHRAALWAAIDGFLDAGSD
jgi:lysophospholipase